MKKKLIFFMLAVFLLSPWPVAYAYDNTPDRQGPMQVAAATHEAAPRMNAFIDSIGGVTPGDLFYIDNIDNTADMPVTLYITNTDELLQCYRYLTLNIAVYVQTGNGQWEKVTTGNGEPLTETYLTMLNGSVSFTLPGYAKYKITIDKGCFYCHGSTAEGITAPKFYLSAG